MTSLAEIVLAAKETVVYHWHDVRTVIWVDDAASREESSEGERLIILLLVLTQDASVKMLTCRTAPSASDHHPANPDTPPG